MSLNAEQKSHLAAPLSRAHVKSRSQAGRQLSYIESWHAIAEANRIFDFDGWSSETVDIKCVHEGEREIGQQKRAGWAVSYTAKVRVTVAGIVREGIGAGHGIDVDKGLAHESAIKEAESDARKRCLMTFGNPFGLALYDKTQSEVVDEPKPTTGPFPPKQDAKPEFTSDPPKDAYKRTLDDWKRILPQWKKNLDGINTVRALNDWIQLLDQGRELAALTDAWPAAADKFNGEVNMKRKIMAERETMMAGA